MKNVIKYSLIIGSLLIISFFLGKCSTLGERKQIINNLEAARDSVHTFIIEVDGLKYKTTQKDAIILSQKDAIAAGILERERLKALHMKEVVANAELKATISILRDSLKIPPETIIITIKDTAGIAHDYVKLPFVLLKENGPDLKLTAGMNKNRTAYYDLKVPVYGEMSIGYVRDGFLKTKPVGIFTSDNPNLTINSMDILIVKDEKKFYQKTWFHMLTGAILFETAKHYLLK